MKNLPSLQEFKEGMGHARTLLYLNEVKRVHERFLRELTEAGIDPENLYAVIREKAQAQPDYHDAAIRAITPMLHGDREFAYAFVEFYRIEHSADLLLEAIYKKAEYDNKDEARFMKKRVPVISDYRVESAKTHLAGLLGSWSGEKMIARFAVDYFCDEGWRQLGMTPEIKRGR